ncbi:gamma-glutamyltransferase family protein [Nitratidesulfovibrio liaohensis]|uniref:Gamma-glutamyltransferase family protein n=2 Tax=Nitratidesulfovibrio liaohensis TaxID=2604158 RepID=A0ABY9R3R9_9BACT|nr:gamma-glutamyltransferase family protein [Nitratidesulfovibrio liaohensis]WMW65443.1 gamma-glutamyltransferase family protein [Nitratidesulfovibrio liaohensis]
MLHTPRARRGMVVTPHHLASQAGLAILREGGNAVEAVVAAAATLCAIYPHMTGLGGDGFWLIHEPGAPAPVGIDASGRSGAAVTPDLLRTAGHTHQIPRRGPLAAITVAGAVSGWAAALDHARAWGPTLPLPRLLEEAQWHARHGFAVTAGHHALVRDNMEVLAAQPGFAAQFLPDGTCPPEGSTLRLPALADTLHTLGIRGLDDFYRGRIAAAMAADLARAGSPLTAADLADHRASLVTPLSLRLEQGQVFNLPPPSQGVASLCILGIFERLRAAGAAIEPETFAHLHAIVEATKRAFRMRDGLVGDPDHAPYPAPGSATDPLLPDRLDGLARDVDMALALPWPAPPSGGDTVWLGAVDAQGRAVSCIQSIYFEFGSGVVLPRTGITWQNRGCGFSIHADSPAALAPRRKPFHTLNPAMALLADGRVMPYGTMGGEGQPQTQAAVFTRHVVFGQPLQQAVSAPRWLLGRTWGDDAVHLRLEGRIAPDVADGLRAAGHPVRMVGDYDPVMGHAGAIVRHPDGTLEGAVDPRGDGCVAAW